MKLKSLLFGALSMTVLHLFSQEEINFTAEAEVLPGTVNLSNIDEGNPKVSADGKTLYFTRWHHPQNTGDDHDIWYSNFVDGQWQTAIHMAPPVTNKAGGNTSVETIFPDGNTMMLFGYYKRTSNTMTSGFSISKRDSRGWQFPRGQWIDKLVNKSNTTGYCLAPSGKQAIISIENKGMGKHDLFVTFLTKEAHKWSKPVNMGKVINSKGGEGTPFLSADGKTLFFSSNGHGGYGGTDIFMSKRLDDTWTNWSKPINLGPKINNDKWNAYFSIDAAGKYAYFVSENGAGNEDIWRIEMPSEAKPDPLVLVSGKVLNQKTQAPVATEIKYYDLATGEEIGYANSDPKTGEYKIALPKGKRYSYFAQSTNFYALRENLDLKALEEYKEVERNLLLAPIEKGEVVRLNNIFFESGKAELLPESFDELNKLAEVLNENSDLSIKIKGHTDNVGSDEDNKTLSQQRAESVFKYLQSQKVKKSKLQFEGYGETAPIATNDTDEGRALNRRVEFEIL